MKKCRACHLFLSLVIVAVVMILWFIPLDRENRMCAKNFSIVEDGSRTRSKIIEENTQENRESPGTEDYILLPANLCKRGNSLIHLDYLVLIYSAPNHFDQRKAVRETWVFDMKRHPNIRTAFLLARTEDDKVQRSIETESYLHADIIQGTFFDHYRNLTLKTKMMMTWVMRFCPHVNFLFKSDDDTFVNVGNILKVTKDKSRDAIYGELHVNEQPRRNSSSKWYVSKEEYKGTEYPPFVAGAFYVLGGRTLRRLYNAMEQVPFICLEDVFLTGFVAEKVGVDRILEKAIRDNEKVTACDVTKKATSHYITPNMMRLFWYQIHYSIVKC
ncbi:beta-1,3-galactosyltransferase 5-like [Ixodes scapularis]|uniref:Hexosyltransferase n=1 Tax=Ixodes scapularis TaxID=6945 RepID=B7PSG7_IXOSC|nr:beta-1,3-galactosyltransferase 5-like [Ixodes scapularis]EEC09539.1 galactosyltransferase, putative [Ixodes scapularis]|eukprot:XP_002402490.1 galactosyltransferase, putative [Ixodes scapularis]